ncbi:hypothetical protein CBE37_02485 [bacterium TMED277]|nr:MAG: hypothetical protein CBE37_02485 [bacterium TMED277]|tara:strand:- start:176 stop:403 length:228 start_codon:yes stop_codon:yes gene_type:complete
MNLENKMLNRKISQLIITFAFFYSTMICHFKAVDFHDEGRIFLSYFLWFCSLTSFLGGLRFQIAKLVEKIKSLKK